MQVPSGPKARIRVWLAFLSLFVGLVVLSIGAWYLAGLARLGNSIADREGQATLQGIAEPAQIDEALRQHPSNKYLQMAAMATRAADDTRAAADKLSSQVEQPAIPAGIVLTALSRGELEALRRNLATAQTNALAFMPRYAEVLKTERGGIEKFALSQHVEQATLVKFLDVIDKRQAEMMAFTSRTMAARAEFYRAYESLVAVIVGETGSYRVADGQFIFQFPRTVDRYNSAATATAAAARRVGELAEEGKSLDKAQQAAWLRFVNGK
jgi:hypothetical protein